MTKVKLSTANIVAVLLDFCKEFIEETDPNRKKLEEVQDLIDKRYNIIGAQMILIEVKN